MFAAKASRAQSRRMQKLADRIGCIAQADRRYLERFPHRRHRVRDASQAEIEQAELLGQDISLPSGKQHYSSVRYLTPYCCLRAPNTGPAEADPERFDEELARAIFKENGTKLHSLEMLELIKARK